MRSSSNQESPDRKVLPWDGPLRHLLDAWRKQSSPCPVPENACDNDHPALLDAPPKQSRPNPSATLLLRVRCDDGRIQELYLAPGLTIGRAVSNTVILADDTSVPRQHSQVYVESDGSVRLRGVDAECIIEVAGKSVKEVPLRAGVSFRIGRTVFECLSGQTRSTPAQAAECPFCGALDAAADTAGQFHCTACGEPLLRIELTASGRAIFVPCRYGRYRAERFVARGGMGLVLQGICEDANGAQPVAIKLLLDDDDSQSRLAARFRQEIDALARVKHPNVVRWLDHGNARRIDYLVMEWVEGGSLKDRIAAARLQQRHVEFDDAIRWFAQVCEGLAALHEKGMVHRDIKPSNILLTGESQARLADLGLAKPLEHGIRSLTTTRTGGAVGTYEYMSPEQLTSPEIVDQRSDLYSLGIAFYEVLTGELPPRGEFVPASSINPTVPNRFDRILKKATARRPAERFADARELLHALDALYPVAPAAPHMWGWAQRIRNIIWQKLAPSDFLGKCVYPKYGTVKLRQQSRVLDGSARLVDPCVVKRVCGVWLWVRTMSGPGWIHRGQVVAATTAKEYFCQRLATNRNDEVALVTRARIHQDKGQIEWALQDLDQCLRLNSRNADARYYRGRIQQDQGDRDQASADYEAAISIDPGHANAFNQLGNLYSEENDVEMALDYYGKAIRANPRHISALSNRAGIWSRRQEHAKAIDDYTQLLLVDPLCSSAFVKRAEQWKALGDLHKANADFGEALRLDPHNEEVRIRPDERVAANATQPPRGTWGEIVFAWVIVAVVRYYYFPNQGHLRGPPALSNSEQRSPLLPDELKKRAEKLVELGTASLLQNKCVEAIAHYSEALRHDPKSPKAFEGRGDAWFRMGDFDKAITDFDDLIRLQPHSARAFNKRGRAWYEKGDYVRSTADYIEYLRRTPDDADVREEQKKATPNGN